MRRGEVYSLYGFESIEDGVPGGGKPWGSYQIQE